MTGDFGFATNQTAVTMVDHSITNPNSHASEAARLISIFTSPKLTIFVLLFYIAAFRHASVEQTIFLAAYALLSIALLKSLQKGAIDDHHDFSDPKHRRTRYGTFLLFIGLCSAFLSFASAGSDEAFEAKYFSTTIMVTAALLFMTWVFHFKMSAHVTFLGISILFVTPLGFVKYACFLASAAIVGWARVRLLNHSTPQVLCTIAYMLAVFLLWDRWI